MVLDSNTNISDISVIFICGVGFLSILIYYTSMCLFCKKKNSEKPEELNSTEVQRGVSTIENHCSVSQQSTLDSEHNPIKMTNTNHKQNLLNELKHNIPTPIADVQPKLDTLNKYELNKKRELLLIPELEKGAEHLRKVRLDIWQNKLHQNKLDQGRTPPYNPHFIQERVKETSFSNEEETDIKSKFFPTAPPATCIDGSLNSTQTKEPVLHPTITYLPSPNLQPVASKMSPYVDKVITRGAYNNNSYEESKSESSESESSESSSKSTSKYSLYKNKLCDSVFNSRQHIGTKQSGCIKTAGSSANTEYRYPAAGNQIQSSTTNLSLGDNSISISIQGNTQGITIGNRQGSEYHNNYYSDGMIINNSGNQVAMNSDGLIINNPRNQVAMNSDGMFINNPRNQVAMNSDGMFINNPRNQVTMNSGGMFINNPRNQVAMNSAGMFINNPRNQVAMNSDGMFINNSGKQVTMNSDGMCINGNGKQVIMGRNGMFVNKPGKQVIMSRNGVFVNKSGYYID